MPRIELINTVQAGLDTVSSLPHDGYGLAAGVSTAAGPRS
jgi:hypothetical protein